MSVKGPGGAWVEASCRIHQNCSKGGRMYEADNRYPRPDGKRWDDLSPYMRRLWTRSHADICIWPWPRARVRLIYWRRALEQHAVRIRTRAHPHEEPRPISPKVLCSRPCWHSRPGGVTPEPTCFWAEIPQEIRAKKANGNGPGNSANTGVRRS